MYIKNLLAICTLILVNSITLANPPVEIIQSCKNMTAANKSVVMTELDGVGFNKTPDSNCRDQFESQINGHTYGWLICDENPYLMIADKKIPLESATNLSISPSVKPDTPIIQTALWWKIYKADKSYLCIISPLSVNGAAANALQYFLVEDAFDVNRSKYNIYFYFFNKDF